MTVVTAGSAVAGRRASVTLSSKLGLLANPAKWIWPQVYKVAPTLTTRGDPVQEFFNTLFAKPWTKFDVGGIGHASKQKKVKCKNEFFFMRATSTGTGRWVTAAQGSDKYVQAFNVPRFTLGWWPCFGVGSWRPWGGCFAECALKLFWNS